MGGKRRKPRTNPAWDVIFSVVWMLFWALAMVAIILVIAASTDAF